MFSSLWKRLDGILSTHISFLYKAFSDNGSPSASRLMTVPHSIAAIFVLLYITIKTGHYPAADEAAGLGAFATAHYAVNKVTGIFQKKDNTTDSPPVDVKV